MNHHEEWVRLAERIQSEGCDLQATSKSGKVYRGPIEKIGVDDDGCLCIDLSRMAVREGRDKPWVKVESPVLSHRFYVDFYQPVQAQGALRVSNDGKSVILSSRDRLDFSEVLTRWYVAVHLAHSLYPPYPSEIFPNLGMAYNVSPKNPVTQDEVTVTAVVLVIDAPSWISAERQARKQCRDQKLPIVKTKKTKLVPGY